MKKHYISLILLTLTLYSFSQNMTIQSGAILTTDPSASIVFNNCNLINSSSSSNFSQANLLFTGNQNSSVGGPATVLNAKQITVNKTDAYLIMIGDWAIQEKVIFQSGNINLNNKLLALAPVAIFQGEKGSSRLMGPIGGYAQIDVNMNNPILENPGNLGLSVTTPSNLGTVTVQRGHKMQTNNGDTLGIQRHYVISSTSGNAFNGTLRFAYFDEELANQNESTLQVWSSTDGISWTNEFNTGSNQITNYVESSNLPELKRFTLQEPLPGLQSKPGTVYLGTRVTPALTVYPNPTKGVKNIFADVLLNNTESGQLILFNSLGQPMYKKLLTGSQKNIDLPVDTLSSGIYFIRLFINDKEHLSAKLIVS